MNRVGSNTISYHRDVRRAELGAGWNQKLRVMDDSPGIHSERRMIGGTAIENVAGSGVAKTDDRIVRCHRRIVSVSDCLGETVNLTSVQRICCASDQGRWNAGNVGLPDRVRGPRGSVNLDVR